METRGTQVSPAACEIAELFVAEIVNSSIRHRELSSIQSQSIKAPA